MNNPNPIIPWCAKTYFADPSKWELIDVNGDLARASLPIINLDGTLCYPHLWKGMREKYTPRKVWLLVWEDGGVTAYGNKRNADAILLQDLSSSYVQEVELIPPKQKEEAIKNGYGA